MEGTMFPSFQERRHRLRALLLHLESRETVEQVELLVAVVVNVIEVGMEFGLATEM
jgi:hypothetical protein